MLKTVTLIIIFISIFTQTSFVYVYADDKADLEKKVQEYQQKLNDARQQKNTLSSQIQYMDNQITLTGLRIQETEAKIASTQKEIQLLGDRIVKLDSSLDTLTKQLLERVVDGYKQQTASVFDYIFNSSYVGALLSKYKYLKTAQQNNEKLLMQVQEIKSNFEEQKVLREKKKIELDDLTKSLSQQKSDMDSQVQQKQKLLIETQNDEATYQRLLAQAQAQLAAFNKFVVSQGGSGLLGNQTVCDDWGCYYNQRDSQWGGNSLNGTQYTLADSGCLISSMAMVYTHFGHRNVTPQTINGNPSNFASYYPAYLNFKIVADGASASRVVISSIDSELSSGRPVVVGISYDGGPLPDHFLVLISGSGGSYQMNDPYTENGHNIPFTSKYSLSSIVVVYRVEI